MYNSCGKTASPPCLGRFGEQQMRQLNYLDRILKSKLEFMTRKKKDKPNNSY